MKKLLISVFMTIATAIGGGLYYMGADARYVKNAIADFPAWQAAHLAQCQQDLGGNPEECQCLIDKAFAWDTEENRPPSDARIWDHAYIQSVYYSDDWNRGKLENAINVAIEKEVGPKNMKSQKALDIYNRYFDEVSQAITFRCFKHDQAYYYMDEWAIWNNLVDITDGAYLVGRERARLGMDQTPVAQTPIEDVSANN